MKYFIKIFISSPAGAGAESSRASAVNSPAVMAEEEGKQEMTEETGSQSQEEGCQAEEELELETDFFGLNDTKKEDNVQVKHLLIPRSTISMKITKS